MNSALTIPQLFFLIAVIIYALFSEPTPDTIGIDEILIGSLLSLAFIRSVPTILGSFLLEKRSYIEKVIYMIFLYMLIVPSIIGIIKEGNDFRDFIRDVIPLLYLFLPIIIISIINSKTDPMIWNKIILFSIIFIGIIFSLMFYLSTKDYLVYITTQIIYGDKAYIFSSPSILFSSIFLTLWGIYSIYKLKSANLFMGFAFTFLGLLSLGVFVAVIMRANILLFSASVAFFVVFIFIKSLKENRILSSIVIISIMFSFIIVNINYIEGVFNLIFQKFQTVGINNRVEEFKYVFNQLQKDTFEFLLGNGWGAILYDNPTGGNTRYTHNILSFFLFKTGIVGLFIVILYLLYLLYNLTLSLLRVKENPIYIILFLSFLSSLIISMFVQPLFKMFSSGLALSLLILTAKSKVS